MSIQNGTDSSVLFRQFLGLDIKELHLLLSDEVLFMLVSRGTDIPLKIASEAGELHG